VPVGRSHSELIAGGLAALLEGGLAQEAVLLSTLTMSSFAGLAVGVVPWLLVGGTLALHHPFDPDAFLVQRQSSQCDTLIVPGPLVAQLADAGYLGAGDGLAKVIGIWRTPERVNRAPPWHANTRMTDVHVFGETGLIAACRDADGKPAAIPFGVVFAPRGPKGTVATVEIAATPHGTVALRGPMVPRAAFPPGAERSGLPFFKTTSSGFVDTGYACLAGSTAMVVTRPPAGIASFGGYRFVVSDLQDLVARPENGAGSLAILPDALAGHRLAGTAADHDLVEQSLERLGANPLLIGAFHGRGHRTDHRRQVA
jgi:hypothetical protein